PTSHEGAGMKRTTLFALAVLSVAVAVAAGTAVAVNAPKPVEFTFTGRLLADPASNATSLSVDVKTGNRLALQKLVGQSRNQTFAYDSHTVFVLWQGRVPTVISATQLQAGDRVSVRVRAPRGSTLAQVEATPANHVAEHEPTSTDS